MKSLILFFVLICLVSILSAQSNPEWIWAKNAGGAYSESGQSIVVDSSGNCYITGFFDSVADFGTTQLTSNGESDIYVAKLDSSGNWLWAVQAGGMLADISNGIALDSNGNTYITGLFQDTATFGTDVITSTGNYDVFVSKLDPGGNWLWTVKAGGSSIDIGYGISVDNCDCIHVAGQYFSSPANFGDFSANSNGYGDIFAAKLDSSGNWLWLAHGGGTGNDIGYGIATDGEGNCILTGRYIYVASFGTHSIQCNESTDDIFIAKADSSGNWLWVRSAGGLQPDCGYGVSCDNSGCIYITGTFRDTCYFGTIPLTMTVNNDLYVAKLSSAGVWLWAVRAGGISLDYGSAITTDQIGRSYVTGYFNGTASFGDHNITSTGQSDIFAACIDSGGNWLWAIKAGGYFNDRGKSIVCNGDGYCWISGYAYGSAYSFGSITLTGYGYDDAFAAKILVPPVPPLAMPFLEDWSSASLDTNFWTADSDNWHIDDNVGNPAPAVVFTGEAGMVSYEYTLTSHEIDGTDAGTVLLKFYLELSLSDGYGGNYISVEVWDGTTWNEIRTYNQYDLYDPQFGIFDITSMAAGNIFKIRFRAFGYDGSYINYWLIDNIMLKQIPSSLPAPQNFSFHAVGTDAFLSWNAVPDADWYAVYASDDPSAVFEYGGWIDSSITSVSIPLNYLWLPRMFYKLTAGSGAPPEVRSMGGNIQFPVLKPDQE